MTWTLQALPHPLKTGLSSWLNEVFSTHMAGLQSPHHKNTLMQQEGGHPIAKQTKPGTAQTGLGSLTPSSALFPAFGVLETRGGTLEHCATWASLTLPTPPVT